MVPEGWSFKTLDNANVKVIDGDRGKEYPKAGDFLESGYCLFLSAKNVTKAGFLFEELQFISEDKDKKLRKGRVERGNIVLTTRGSIGQFAYFDDSVPYDVIRINSGMVVIDATQAELLPEFFYALCRSFIIAKQIEAASFGSAQPQLTVGIIKGIKLPIPPLPEQKKIAQILSTWDKAITTTEQLLVNSQQQKKALMQQLLTGKKRLLDENGVRFSGEWQVLPLGQLTNIFDGTHSTPKYVEDGVPFYSVEHLTANDFSKTKFISEEVFDKENKRVKLERGDILMTRIGDIGTAKHLDWDVRASFYVSLALVKASESFDSEYMTQYINSNIFRSELWKRTIHVAFPKKINLGEISNCLVAIPSLEEQQKISAVLSTADQEITALQQKLDALKQEKKALMQQLLTGKRRVNTAEEEIA